MKLKTFKRIRFLKNMVLGLLIFGVFTSLFAPQASVLAFEKKDEEIDFKIKSVLGDSSDDVLKSEREELLVKILRLMPEEHWKPLKVINFENKIRTPRGLKDKNSIELNFQKIDSDEEFLAVFIHELGHVVDLDVMIGESNTPSEFQFLDGTPIPSDDPSVDFYKITWKNSFSPLPEANYLDAVSEYGFTNAFEDFAESYIFYLLHGKSFKIIAEKNPRVKQKYEFIRGDLFEGQEFSFGDFFYDNEEIYDTTVLYYDLDAFVAMMEAEKVKKQTISRMSSSRPPRFSKG